MQLACHQSCKIAYLTTISLVFLLQDDDCSLDQEMTLLKEIRIQDDLDDVTCLGQQEMTLILHEEHEESEAIG
jgi:hypothetical protein